MYQHREAKCEERKRKEDKEQARQRRMQERADKFLQEAKELRKQEDKITRDAEYARLQKEKEREEAEKKRIFDQEVTELIMFKQKYGLDAMPHTKNYSFTVRRKAYDRLHWEIRHAEILAEEKENAQQFYKVHSWQAVPERWHDMNSEKRALWDKELQKAKDEKKDKGNARLLKALEKLDGHKNS